MFFGNKQIENPETGRSTISNRARVTSFSQRAFDGKLSVIKFSCPHCSHNKVFAYISGRYKCCSCKKEIMRG